MPGLIPVPRLTRLALVASLLAAATPGLAAPDGGPGPASAEAPATAGAAPDLRVDPALASSIFQYASPQRQHRLRAALEIGAGFAYQFIVYLGRPSRTAVESEVLYYPADKLFHGAWAFDANQARTNFGGHPLAGAFYYQIARGNRLGVLESSLAAMATSTIWEVTEYHEQGSINDMVVTPMGGISLGEPFAQLSAFLEQRDAGTGDRVFAWVFQPFKKAHDLWDGATLARRPEALAWHDFRLDARGGAVRRAGGTSAEGGLSLTSVLVRGAHHDEVGRGVATFADGNAVRIDADLLAAADGLASARLESAVALVGLYARDLEAAGEGVAGQDLLVGAGTSFEIAMRRHDSSIAPDWYSLVHVPGVAATWRALGGAVPLEATVRGAVTFGGVHSLVLAAESGVVPEADLPVAARAYGYYYSLGWMAAARVEASPGPIRLGAAARFDDFHGFPADVHDAEPLPGANPATLRDRRGEARGWARWRIGSFGLGAEVVRAWADGRVAEARRSAATTDLLLTLEFRG